ncbi:hypothetical protein IFM89_007534 [Coptis chinensis]|uniref:Exocyst component Exo84 C-terminal domain-containing protein n=1 Tax=Coptis chinensis TaxID=261450 RepID=A0A835I196_9MAGN|nr:hypothetical protein IFM89_007534 [Coptis chinensis]
MDSSTRFRFRDSTDLNSSSDDSSSVSSVVVVDDDDESKIESLTAKGIKRLCSELLELKKASDDEFHSSVYLNYAAFLGIFEQVGGIGNELMQLKQHVSTQRGLVKDLMDCVYPEVLSRDLIIGESLDGDQSPWHKLEGHTEEVSDTLDILLSEHRLNEALAILDLEDITLKMIYRDESPPAQLMEAYDSAIAERKSILADRLAGVADHPRVAAAEFQRALSGLCRLGFSQRATQLMLKFYHSRLEKGVNDLQFSKSFIHRSYIRELAKLVFSTISQAARSFVILYGEKSPYASEMIQWAREETEVFVSYFHKYVKSISEVNGGLSTAVEAVQYAISFCSILETQSIVLCPFLAKLIHPCVEEVLMMHIDHYKKVIGVFTATDTWVLGKYLIPGILKEEASPMVIGDKMEYCLLTNSGRKLVTLLQATMKEISPLVILQMENLILDGLLQLFKEYIYSLERAISSKADVSDRIGSRIVLAETHSQQLSVLANSSALVQIVSNIARNIFKGFKVSDGQLLTDIEMVLLYKELDNWIFSIQDAADQLKNVFYQQTIYKVTFPKGESVFGAETYCGDHGDSDASYDLMPSITFQELFLQLRQLEEVGKYIFNEVDWSMKEFLRKLMETFFVWLENNQDFWTTIEENSTFEHSYGFEQFVLDMQFLVEITRFGGYYSSNLSDASSALISRMESVFLSAGVETHRDVLCDGWATNAATESIQKLLENEKSDLLHNEEDMSTSEEDPSTHQDVFGADSVENVKNLLEDSTELDDGLTSNAADAAVAVVKEIQSSEDTTGQEPLCLRYEENMLDDEDALSSTDRFVPEERTEITNADNGAITIGENIGNREESALESSPSTLVENIGQSEEGTEATNADNAASDENEDEERLLVEDDFRSSCGESIGSADELASNMDGGTESPVLETSARIALDSE